MLMSSRFFYDTVSSLSPRQDFMIWGRNAYFLAASRIDLLMRTLHQSLPHMVQ